MAVKYYICENCGNLYEAVHSSGVPVMCCGQKMKELVPGSVDASVEKHVPAVKVDGNVVNVSVGDVEHPMVDEHYIEWVSLQTNKGVQRKSLAPGEAPSASFALAEGEKPEAAYAYCNLHGLWKKDI